MKPDELIIDFVVKWVEQYWNEVDLKFWEVKETKEEFIKLLKSDVQVALWVLTEWSNRWCTNLGSGIKVLKDIFIEANNSDFLVIKLGGHYIKLSLNRNIEEYTASFCEKKEKIVYYFE